MPFKNAAVRKAWEKEYLNQPNVSARRKAKQREWRKANTDHLAELGARRRIQKRAMCLIAGARVRARRHGAVFDLDPHVTSIQRRIDAGSCELSGTPFDLSPGRTFASPSLDRINPSRGYVYANIRVICHAMNTALGDWGEVALATVIEGWLQNAPSTRGSRRSS